MNEPLFIAPTAPAGPWNQLTKNEKAWIEMIRVISAGRDPGLTLQRVQALTELLSEG